jgi:hypothetical protein
MSRVLAWFSCGAASAVAAKLSVDKYGDRCVVVNCDTLSTEHPDNERFLKDVQAWIGVDIVRIKSDKYKDVDDVFEKTRYMSGVAGARCTGELKKLPREKFQQPGDVHVFGYTSDEYDRAAGFEERNPQMMVEWPLIEAGISKTMCFEELAAAGIELPAMYALGYEHNNCLGCVKATSPRYWNKIRKNFPDVFARRARQSREINAKLVRVGRDRLFLDELPEDADGPNENIECGPVCQQGNMFA